jgi:hypothetical protein
VTGDGAVWHVLTRLWSLFGVRRFDAAFFLYCFLFRGLVCAKEDGSPAAHPKRDKKKESGVKTPHSKSTKCPSSGA